MNESIIQSQIEETSRNLERFMAMNRFIEVGLIILGITVVILLLWIIFNHHEQYP